MARRPRDTTLPAPFLRSLTLKGDREEMPGGYPFDLPWLTDDFTLSFEQPVTILTGENGSGKSTLIEAIAALAGFDEAGGGKGYAAVDHSGAIDRSGARLADHLRGGWLPKITRGWFFRAETFFSVARYLDTVGSPAADFLSWSHGEGFLLLFEERLGAQGLYLMDEPESALSPRRQAELLRMLADVQDTGRAQVILATHSPILMAVPGADLRAATRHGFRTVSYRDTEHFRLYQSFTVDPEDFVARVIEGDFDGLV